MPGARYLAVQVRQLRAAEHAEGLHGEVALERVVRDVQRLQVEPGKHALLELRRCAVKEEPAGCLTQ